MTQRDRATVARTRDRDTGRPITSSMTQCRDRDSDDYDAAGRAGDFNLNGSKPRPRRAATVTVETGLTEGPEIISRPVSRGLRACPEQAAARQPAGASEGQPAASATVAPPAGRAAQRGPARPRREPPDSESLGPRCKLRGSAAGGYRHPNARAGR